MPKIVIPELYNAILSAAKEIFAKRDALNPFFTTRSEGTPLYRYVSYYNLRPQDEANGRKIWTLLANDTGNRWTGLGTDGTGSQGLYMSGEFINDGSPFPELEHYQNPTVAGTQEINYFRYEAGRDPAWIRVPARELRTMFLFTQTRALNGIDFSLKVNGADHPLLTEILERAKQSNRTVFTVKDDLRSLYTSPDDASFNRAIGNALFELGNVDFFQATSVRDEKSPNIILRGTQGNPIDYLRAEGRATFIVDPEGRRGIGVYTIDDLIYNSRFEQTGLEKIPPKDVFANLLSLYGTTIEKIASDNIDWDYISKKIDDAVDINVSKALDRIDNPFNQSIEDLTASLSAQVELRDSLYQELSGSILTFLTQSPDILALYQNIGMEGIRSVSDALIVGPRYSRLVNAFPNVNAPPNIVNSYLEIAVRKTLLEMKTHWSSGNQQKIQQELTGAESRISETSSELQSKKDALKEVEEQLKQGSEDLTLKQQQSDLNREISDLVKRQAEVEAEKAQLEEKKQESQRDARKASEEKERSSRELDNHRNDVFKGE